MKRVLAAAAGVWLLVGALGCDFSNGTASSAGSVSPSSAASTRSAPTAERSPAARSLIAASSAVTGASASAARPTGSALFDGDTRAGVDSGLGDAIPVSRPSVYTGPFTRYSPPSDLRISPPPAPGASSSVAAAVRALGGNTTVGAKVVSYAQRLGVDPALALAIAKAESGIGTNTRTSRAGAIGVMQVLPETGRSMGVNAAALHGDLGIYAGVKYIKNLMSRFGDDLTNVAWGYNAGPGAVRRRLPNETRNYIAEVTSAYRKLQGMLSL